jgi:hypothetical protein
MPLSSTTLTLDGSNLAESSISIMTTRFNADQMCLFFSQVKKLIA